MSLVAVATTEIGALLGAVAGVHWGAGVGCAGATFASGVAATVALGTLAGIARLPQLASATVTTS